MRVFTVNCLPKLLKNHLGLRLAGFLAKSISILLKVTTIIEILKYEFPILQKKKYMDFLPSIYWPEYSEQCECKITKRIYAISIEKKSKKYEH